MIKAVGFDLGETLIYNKDIPLSWQGLYRQALSAVSERCGYDPGEARFAVAESILARYNTRLNPRIVECPSDIILSEILNAWGLSPIQHLHTATETFFSFFRQDIGVYEDVTPMLLHFKSFGVPIGILTDVPYGMPRRFVESDVAPFVDYVDVLLTSVDTGFRKPDPRGYLQLADKLGVIPQQLAYTGNEPKDIEVAKAAGSIAIFLDRENSGVSHGEDLRITSLLELIPANGTGLNFV